MTKMDHPQLASNDRELFQRIWRLSWPMVVYNLLEMTVGMVDLGMVRSFGPSATAAVGVSRQITILVEGAAIAISAGVIALVSQHTGGKRDDRVREIVRQSFYLVLLFGVLIAIVGTLAARPLLVAMNASDRTLVHGVPYLQIYFVGTVFFWGSLVGTAIFRGSGDVWTPLKLAVGVNVLNVVLNYLFIFGGGPLPAFEVPGAAMATTVARACGALACGVMLYRSTQRIGQSRVGKDKSRSIYGKWSEAGQILRIGTPMALASLLRNGSRMVFMAIVGVGSAGVSMHAAVGVGLQLRLISVVPALAFQAATATLVGQAIGRRDEREAEALGRRAALLLSLIGAVLSGILFICAAPLAAFFIASADAAELGTRVLRWFAVAQWFSAQSISVQGALMGAKDTAPALRYTLLSQWGVMIPLAYLTMTAGWMPDGPLAAWTLAPAISLLLTWRRFQSGRWKESQATS